MIYAIRGATTVEADTKELIVNSTQELLTEIMKRNNLEKDNVVFILFTMTKDLRSVFPAYAARMIGFSDIPLIDVQQLDIDNSLERCIRILMLVQADDSFRPRHVYLKDAKSLREDIQD